MELEAATNDINAQLAMNRAKEKRAYDSEETIPEIKAVDVRAAEAAMLTSLPTCPEPALPPSNKL